jgi:hypothetical protein
MKNQKEGVYDVVMSVVGSFEGACSPTKEQRGRIIGLVTEQLMNDEIQMSAEAKDKYTTVELMKGYVNGLVSNWLRKDTRLNGGTKYEAKNPGSRTGSGDEVLKNLKNLRATLADASHIQAVDEEIEKRVNELAQVKAKTVTIDISKIPEELRHLIPTAS